MKRQDAVIAVAAVAAVAYCGYGFYTETGLVGWVNYAQQQVFGSYSLKLTMVLVMFGVMTLLVGAYSVLARLAGAGNDGSMRRLMLGPERARGPAPPLSTRSIWLSAAVLVAATWVIGFGVQRWLAAAQQEDAAAHYETIVLGGAAAAPPPGVTHLRLQGRLIGEHVLTHKSSGREDYHLVPVAGPDWRPGQPVGYVLKVARIHDLPGQRPAFRPYGQAPPPPDALLGRIVGEVPVPAAQEFGRIGVTLAPDSRLVRLVPSKGEGPDVRDTRDEDFQIFLYICGGLSALFVLIFGLIAFIAARQRRQLAGARLA